MNDSPTRKRIALFRVAMSLVAWCLIELVALVAFRPITGARFLEPIGPGGQLREEPSTRREGRERAGLGFKDPLLSLHPYLGYVFTPPLPDSEPLKVAISPDGFLDEELIVRRRGDGVALVGLTGGSVAGQLGSFFSGPFREALAGLPQFQGKRVELVRLGMPGYHQPQQLIQLAYLLAQGGELDLLINLDGFNEVAVPVALNLPKGAHPLFPMNWSMVALDTPDIEARRLIGAVAYLEDERAALTRRRAALWRFRLPSLRFSWKLGDLALERKAARYAFELHQLPVEDVPFFVRGPEWSHDPPGGMMPWLVEVWKTSSLQMQAICQANGIRYLHLLQPNQYLPGSKPLSVEEKTQAFNNEGPYKSVVEDGYPLLIGAGERLRAAGVEFHDLSGLFRGTEETLYIDTCCHFNEEGNRQLIAAIAATLEE